MTQTQYMCPIHKIRNGRCCDLAEEITGDESIEQTTDQLSKAQGSQHRWNRPQDNN